MLNNYQYFIALTEMQNISKAAQTLFISHQCLSRYLKTLEQEYGVTFFERTPRLTLTPAGEAYLDTVRQLQLLEENLNSRLSDIRQSKQGYLRLGTTAGRYRILIPDLISHFQKIYPDVLLDVQYSTNSKELCTRILENELDIALLNSGELGHKQLEVRPVLQEHFHVVISDNMLKAYFPDRYPQCKQDFAAGVDLAELQHIPFVMSMRYQTSRIALEQFLRLETFQLKCVMELPQVDLHLMMTARDYAACFCWSMYLPTLEKMNQESGSNQLNPFPIKGWKMVNQVVLVTRRGRIFPAYGRDLMRLIKEECTRFDEGKSV